jgi:hypothetical protein
MDSFTTVGVLVFGYVDANMLKVALNGIDINVYEHRLLVIDVDPP